MSFFFRFVVVVVESSRVGFSFRDLLNFALPLSFLSRFPPPSLPQGRGEIERRKRERRDREGKRPDEKNLDTRPLTPSSSLFYLSLDSPSSFASSEWEREKRKKERERKEKRNRARSSERDRASEKAKKKRAPRERRRIATSSDLDRPRAPPEKPNKTQNLKKKTHRASARRAGPSCSTPSTAAGPPSCTPCPSRWPRSRPTTPRGSLAASAVMPRPSSS